MEPSDRVSSTDLWELEGDACSYFLPQAGLLWMASLADLWELKGDAYSSFLPMAVLPWITTLVIL